jgi:hypothetical protein
MVVVPALNAHTSPVDGSIVATPGALLLQVPPEGLPVNRDTSPTHSVVGPDIDVGDGNTVNV